jgi:hypothetical protein
VRELLVAAREGLIAHGGDATPIEVSRDFDAGVTSICVHQLPDVVDTVKNPKRIALLTAQRIDHASKVGKRLSVAIRYTNIDDWATTVSWRDAVPLRAHDVRVEDVINDYLSRAVYRY